MLVDDIESALEAARLLVQAIEVTKDALDKIRDGAAVTEEQLRVAGLTGIELQHVIDALREFEAFYVELTIPNCLLE